MNNTCQIINCTDVPYGLIIDKSFITFGIVAPYILAFIILLILIIILIKVLKR